MVRPSAARTDRLSAVVLGNLERFEAIARRRDELAMDVDVAGRRVRIRILSPTLADMLLGALRHRRLDADGEPALTICAWDLETTGESAITAGLEAADSAPDARTWTCADRAFVAIRGVEPWAVRGYDPAANAGFLWARDPETMARWGERTKPFLDILHSWLLDTPWQPVHGGAVGGPGGGIVLAGASGAGKSTTALACVRAGWHYAGDDYVVIGGGGEPRVENLYASARLRRDMAERLAEFRPAEIGTITALGDERRDLLLSRMVPTARIDGFPVRAILLPGVTSGSRSGLRPATATEAMVALSSVTLHFLRTGAARAFEKIGRFVESLPVYRLDLGRDLDALPSLIATETGSGPR